MSQPLLISIEGIISCGKSSLVEKCLVPFLKEKGYTVYLIKEPVKKWEESGLLARFYADPKRYAYHFQSKVCHDLIKEVENIYKKWQKEFICTPQPTTLSPMLEQNCLATLSPTAAAPHDVRLAEKVIFISERSVISNSIFARMLAEDGTMDSLEYDHYLECWEMWTRLLPIWPSLFIYLKPDLELCMQRLKERNREGENVPKEYQQKLSEHHDQVFGNGSVHVNGEHIKSYVLPTTINLLENKPLREETCNQIYQQILSIL